MIIGIDPASKKLALFWEKGGQPSAVTKVVKKSNRAVELSDMRAFLADFLALVSIGEDVVIFCESPVLAGARNIQSTILIAETVGMILSLGYPCYLVAPASWKAKTVGSGNASKSDVACWLAERYSRYSDLCDGDQDLCDAAAIYLYGASVETYQRSVVSGSTAG